MLGTTLDAALTDGFLEVRVFLGIRGDRGQEPTLEKVDDRGNAVVVGLGMVPRGAERAPALISENGSTKVFRVASERAARQFIKSFKRKGQTFTLGDASVSTVYPGPVQMTFGFLGGEDGFRACVKTVLTFVAGAGCEGPPETLEAAWRYIGGLPAEECGVSIAFGAAPPPVEGESGGLGAVSHRVVARSNAAGGWIEADVRYFGDFGLCMRIFAPAISPFCIGHGVDPLTGRTALR